MQQANVKPLRNEIVMLECKFLNHERLVSGCIFYTFKYLKIWKLKLLDATLLFKISGLY